MKPSTRKQIKNGLRLGGSMGAFLIAIMLMGIGVDRLQSGPPGQLRFWPDGAVDGGLIGLALLILVSTARVWVIYLAGCFLFAIPKVLVVIVSRRDFYSPGPFSRLEATELLFFFLASLFLIYRITANRVPTIFDRLAITLYLIVFAYSLSGRFSIVSAGPIIGLAALLVAWYLSRKKHRRHRAASVRTASGQPDGI
jgi:hypothetical protein